MVNLISLLVVVALVSLHCCPEVGAQVDNAKIDLDNNVQPDSAPGQRRRQRKYVQIEAAPAPRTAHHLGARLQLECEAMGAPAPGIHWLKNGEPVADYEDESNEVPTHHPTNIASLTSRLVTSAARDGDVYTCVATAGVNQDSSSTTIYIDDDESPKLLTLEKLFSVPPSPVITEFYNSVLQDIGTALIMPCHVHSTSAHQVYWRDNRGELVYRGSRIRVLPSGDLLIAALRWADMGEWSCTVKSAYGKDSTTTFLYPLKPKKQ